MNTMLKRTTALLLKCVAVLLCMTILFATITVGLSALINRVKIIDNDFFQIIHTLSSKPTTILANAGIKLDGDDTYAMKWLNSREGEIVLKRAVDVTVSYREETVEVSLPEATVAEAVRRAGFVLNDKLALNCNINDTVTNGMKIEIYDVELKTVTEDVTIPFETVSSKSSTLEKGKTQLVKEGKNGTKRITYSCTVIDGEVISKTVESEKVIKAPVNREVLIGTKTITISSGNNNTTVSKPVTTPSVNKPATTPSVNKPATEHKVEDKTEDKTEDKAEDTTEDKTEDKVEEEETGSTSTKIYYTSAGYRYVSTLKPSTDFELTADGRPVNYKRLITGKASAYTYGDGNKTATGKGVRPGYVAVNPKIIPYGTKLFIRTPDGKYMYGYASAEDTGGFIYWSNPRVVDLFFTSESACRTFGVRNIEIYVL